MSLQDRQELIAQLKKRLPPVSVVLGEEVVLVQDCLQRVRRAATEAGFPPRELVFVDSSTDWDGVCAHLASGSLFAERHFVEVLVPPGGGAAALKSLHTGLENLLGAMADSDALLVSLPGVGRGRKPKWLQMAGEKGVVVQMKRMRSWEEKKWLTQELQRRKIALDEVQREMLFARTEGNPLAARMEMDRLEMLAGGEDADLELSVEESGQLDVYQLADACLRGQTTRALKALKSVRAADSNSAPLVFAVLGRYLQIALRAQWLQQRGAPLTRVLEQENVWTRDRKSMAGLLERLDGGRLGAVARRMRSLDANIKGQGDGQAPWSELGSLVLAICGLFPFRRAGGAQRLRRPSA